MAQRDAGGDVERIRRGDLWTVTLEAFPKPRPALVVSIDPLNDLRPEVVVVPITTRPGPLRVEMPDAPAMTGLRERSYVKCESLGPLHESQMKARIGQLPRSAWPAIEAGLCRVLGIRVE